MLYMYVEKVKKLTNDGHYVHDRGRRRMIESYLRYRNVFEKSYYLEKAMNLVGNFHFAGVTR